MCLAVALANWILSVLANQRQQQIAATGELLLNVPRAENLPDLRRAA